MHYQVRTCDNRLVATTVHANRLKHFYDPADRPILPPAVDDPDDLAFDAADLPADSFSTDDSPPSSSTNAEPIQDANENPNASSVDSTDVFQEPDVFAAKEILRSRTRNGKIQYLIRWANYPVSDATWEPAENILDQRLLDEFQGKST